MTANHTVVLTYGSELFNFNSGSNSLMEYIPQSPDMTTMDTNSVLRDGGERTMTTRRNVTETLRYMASASSQTEIQTAKQQLQRLLTKAERRQNSRSGSAVYINFGPYNISGSYRSEILGGRIDMTDRSFNATHWGNRKVEFMMTFTRRYFWEGDEVTIGDIKNSHGTGASIQVYNHNDSGHNNYIEISASSVTGEISTPPKISLINSAGSTMYPRDIFISHNVINNPGSFSHMIEGESASTSGSIVASANYSSGSALQMWTGASSLTTQNRRATWELTGSILDNCYGSHFAILARLDGTPVTASTYVQVKLVYPWSTGLSVLFEGPEIEISPVLSATYDGIFNFGTLKLPPNLSFTSGFDSIGLSMYVRTSASYYINVDYIQLSPVDTGFRRINQVGVNGWVSGQIALDEPNESTYSSGSTSAEASKYNLFTLSGKQINLYPGELQRLYILQSDYDTNYHVYSNRVVYARVSYRPRRLTL